MEKFKKNNGMEDHYLSFITGNSSSPSSNNIILHSIEFWRPNGKYLPSSMTSQLQSSYQNSTKFEVFLIGMTQLFALEFWKSFARNMLVNSSFTLTVLIIKIIRNLSN